MKRLVKSFFLTLLIAVSVVPTVVHAQRGGDRQQMREFQNIPHEIRTEAQIAVFDEYLNLSDDQENQLMDLGIEFAEKGQALREESMRPRRKRLAAEDLRNEHQQAIHDVLTKDQYSIYLEEKEAIQYDIRQRLRAYSEDGNK
jgi:hypothetical protein